jgi:DNA-binding transcriptional MerR regulator
MQATLMDAPIESFTSGKAAKLAGITFRQLCLWSKDELIVPSVADTTGTGSARGWSFRDICIMRAMARLRSIGVTPKAMRKIANRLRAYSAEFTDLYLVVNNSDVVFKSGEELVSMWKQPGQLVMAFVLSLQHCEEEVIEAMAA